MLSVGNAWYQTRLNPKFGMRIPQPHFSGMVELSDGLVGIHSGLALQLILTAEHVDLYRQVVGIFETKVKKLDNADKTRLVFWVARQKFPKITQEALNAVETRWQDIAENFKAISDLSLINFLFIIGDEKRRVRDEELAVAPG